MSTQTYTPNQQTPSQGGSDHNGGRSSRFRIWAAVIGSVAVAALVALAVVLSTSHGSQAPAASSTPTSTSAPAQPAANPANPAQPTGGSATPAQPTGGSATPTNTTGGSTGHTTGGTTPAKPSASVMKLQQELGQLNYYEGPDNGIMGPQTIAAIKDLQRQAGLPQTGQMNSATQAALNNYLAHGNNQMGGNS
jgi:Putative peptidoglycan binding domain